jgi:hypothetical protein
MSKLPSLDELWDSVPQSGAIFHPADIITLPEPARCYLEHAIAPGTPLASAVRLRMHGQFRLKKDWCPFTAEQVIRWDGEMLWRTMRLHGLPIQGFDSVVEGRGRMQWKLFGLFPLAAAEGPEITRSAVGRVEGETVWLPSLLWSEDVIWRASNNTHAHAHFSLLGEKTELVLTVGETGRLEQVRYKRWGNPENGPFHYEDFGGVAEEEGTFGGYTIPTRLRVGWYFGSDRFVTEGEFFRVTIDDATFR